jgi:hypothetical protein
LSYESFAADTAGPRRRSRKNRIDRSVSNPAKMDDPPVDTVADAVASGGCTVAGVVGAALIICACE